MGEIVVSCDSNPCNSLGDTETGCKLLLHYDADGDGNIGDAEVSKASYDLAQGTIAQEEADFITACWKLAAPNINKKCPGCYAEKGTLDIATVPTGATIKVYKKDPHYPCSYKKGDLVTTYTTPSTVDLLPDTYCVVISKTGYEEWSGTPTITAGKTRSFTITLTRLEVTITFVTKKEDGTTLTGVSVYINEIKKGET